MTDPVDLRTPGSTAYAVIDLPSEKAGSSGVPAAVLQPAGALA
jgi:hypothetical protein